MSEELFEHHKLVADPGQQPLRVDKFLMNLIAHISRNKLQIAAKSGYIRVDGKPVKSNFKIKAGHVVTVELPQPVYEFELLPEEMELDIVFEDNDVLVVNKQTKNKNNAFFPPHNSLTKKTTHIPKMMALQVSLFKLR